jgi:hypothetical protein
MARTPSNGRKVKAELQNSWCSAKIPARPKHFSGTSWIAGVSDRHSRDDLPIMPGLRHPLSGKVPPTFFDTKS